MITLQHSLVTLLGINPEGKTQEQIEEEFRRQIPYVLLPDGIRRYTGPRQYSHFEESSDGTEISYMKFPKDIKHFTKESFEGTEKFLSGKITPAVIGETTHVEKFEGTNGHLPETYYKGVKKHLVQDYIFDDFVRQVIDCSDKYNGNFSFNGEKLDGNGVRKLIGDLEMEGFEMLAFMAYKELGITTNQEWFDKNVKAPLDETYPQELADSTYNYMKIPEEINKHITDHDFSDLERRIREGKTIIPYDQYKEMYVKAISQMRVVDLEPKKQMPSLDDNDSRVD